MRKFLIFFPVFLLPPFAAAQDPLEILNRTAALYRTMTTYDFEVVTQIGNQSALSQYQMESRERIAGSGLRYRRESGSPGNVTVFDGEFLWQYYPRNNEYTKRAIRQPGRGTKAAPAARQGGPYEIAQYENIAQRVKNARILRQETLEPGSGPVSCYVVEVEREPLPAPPVSQPGFQQAPGTYWIEMSRGLVWKSVQKSSWKAPDGTQTENANVTSLAKAAINQPVDASLFQFTPPEGAVQVERPSVGPKSQLAGKDLPDFELKTRDGKVITSAGLRGNIAIIHFGHAGSAMQDDFLPFLELLHRSYKGQGVAVLYVMASFSPGATLSDLAERGYTLPAAADPQGAAARSIGLPGRSGTIVTDRGGKILYSAGGFGSQTPGAIVKELQKAGVW